MHEILGTSDLPGTISRTVWYKRWDNQPVTPTSVTKLWTLFAFFNFLVYTCLTSWELPAPSQKKSWQGTKALPSFHQLNVAGLNHTIRLTCVFSCHPESKMHKNMIHDSQRMLWSKACIHKCCFRLQRVSTKLLTTGRELYAPGTVVMILIIPNFSCSYGLYYLQVPK